MAPLRKGVVEEMPVTTDVAPKLSFNWFGLPQELRDEVYEHLLVFKQILPLQHDVRLRARRSIDPRLLTVSRQFKHEYSARAEQRTCLVIVDRVDFEGKLLKLPKPLMYVRKLELHLALACSVQPPWSTEKCRVQKELRMHRKWIVDLTKQMRHLDSITINVLVDPHQQVETCKKNLVAEYYKLTNLEELVSLDVFECDFESRMGKWNFMKPRKPIMKWSARSGELEMVESGVAGKELLATAVKEAEQ